MTNLAVGDQVVIPFQISCGSCYMCDQQLFTQCEKTQAHKGMGAALFGYSELYGQDPGGQAELLRVPQPQFTHIKVPEGPPDTRFVYLCRRLADGLAKLSPTPTSAPAARWRCWDSDRSVTSRLGLPSTWAIRS